MSACVCVCVSKWVSLHDETELRRRVYISSRFFLKKRQKKLMNAKFNHDTEELY